MVTVVETQITTGRTEPIEREAHLETVKGVSVTQIAIIIIDISQTEIDARVAVLIDEAIEIAGVTHEVTAEKDEMTVSLDINQIDREVTPENEITM